MKYLLLLLLLTVSMASAQSPGADGVVRQKEREASLLTKTLNDRARAEGRDDVTRISRNGTVEERLAVERIRTLYREPSESEKRTVAPDPDLTLRYADLLKEKNNGLVRLMPDLGCDEITFRAQRSEKCDQLTIPGGGAAFSFRTKNHRQWRLADLIYDGRNFVAYGQGSQGFLTNLGNVPIVQVTSVSPGVHFMAKFEPANRLDLIFNQNRAFTDRVIDGDHVYSKIIPAKLDTTIVLRSVAYKAHVERDFEGIRFNELSFDKRIDVLIAFRVVRLADDGSVTILWRELSRTDSPKIVAETK